MFAAALHLLLLVLALPSSALRISPAARCPTRAACNSPRTPCILASDAAGDAAELEDPSLSADDMECEARVVTELKDTVNNASLPDRFMMAMRAMRGEFSPSSGDTERDDGQILEAMVDFPADIDLKVVSQSLPAAEQQELVRQLGEVVAALGPSAAEPKVTPRPGDRISIAVTLPKVPSAAALAELRAGMLADERVKFVF